MRRVHGLTETGQRRRLTVEEMVEGCLLLTGTEDAVRIKTQLYEAATQGKENDQRVLDRLIDADPWWKEK